MPVIQFNQGGPEQLKGAHAELAGHQDPEYLEFVKSKLAEHAMFAYSHDFVEERPSGYVEPEAPSGQSSSEIVDRAQAITRFVKAIDSIKPEKIQPKVLKSLIDLAKEIDESGIAIVNEDSQMIYVHDGTVDIEPMTFKGAVLNIGDHESKTRDQDIEIARLFAKEDLNAQGHTVQPGKSVEHDKYAFGNFTSHKSVGKLENGEYTPFATVLAEPFKSDGTIQFGIAPVEQASIEVEPTQFPPDQIIESIAYQEKPTI